VSIAAATLGLLDALTLYALSHAEHVRSIRPSSVISLYLIFTILFDSAQCRTLWLLPGSQVVAGLLTGSIVAKIGMLILEAKEKRNILMPQWKGVSPEATGGVINRGLFWWLNDLMIKGWKGILKVDALYSTDSALDSTELLAMLDATWSRAKQHERHALIKAVGSAMVAPLIAPVLPRIVLMGFRFSQPFLFHTIMDFVGREVKEGDREVGYGLIGATGLVYVGLAVCALSSFKQQALIFHRSLQDYMNTRPTDLLPQFEDLW
jgi:ATP-binding cassette subfamily C (CFTR/MRP) protein 1